MNKELILDIGIHEGGKYINKNTAPNEQRIGIDLSTYGIQGLRDKYPEVLGVISDAKQLPFAADSFKRIEIILPHNSLLNPGLQYYSYQYSSNIEDITNKNMDDYLYSFYPEFQRVLKPEGKLIIIGDNFVYPERVGKTSSDYFIVEEVHKLTIDEFREIGSSVSDAILLYYKKHNDYIRNDKKLKDLLVKINLRSKKTS